MESLNLRVLCALLLAATGVAFALHPRKCSPVPPRRLHKALHDTVGMGSGLPKPYSLEWAQQRGMVPGYGGVWPGDPNAKKYRVTVRTKKGDEFVTDVPADRYIFHYFEEVGIDLPIANKARMCRQVSSPHMLSNPFQHRLISSEPFHRAAALFALQRWTRAGSQWTRHWGL